MSQFIWELDNIELKLDKSSPNCVVKKPQWSEELLPRKLENSLRLSKKNSFLMNWLPPSSNSSRMNRIRSECWDLSLFNSLLVSSTRMKINNTLSQSLSLPLKINPGELDLLSLKFSLIWLKHSERKLLMSLWSKFSPTSSEMPKMMSDLPPFSPWPDSLRLYPQKN